MATTMQQSASPLFHAIANATGQVSAGEEQDPSVTNTRENAFLAMRLNEMTGQQNADAQKRGLANDLQLGNIAATTSRQNNATDNAGQLQAAGYQLKSNSMQQDTTRAGNQLAADTTRQGNQLGADTSRHATDVGAATTNAGNQLAAQTAQRGQDLSLQASLAPTNFARDKFNTILPLLQDGISEYGSNGSNGRLVGGQNVAPQPMGAPVYSDGQVQQQVNAGTQMRDNSQSAAAHGFGPNSPLLMSLNNQVQGQAAATGADQERQTRFDAAGANAKQALGYDTLGVQQANNANQNDIERRKVTGQNKSQLLAILAGLA
jgi:hypothetical protein